MFNYTVEVGTVSHKIHNKTHLKSLKDIHPIAIALSQKNSNRRNAFLFSKKLWQLCVHLYTHKNYLERLAEAALLFGAGDWDLLLFPADGWGRVRRDLVGVPGGEGAASLDEEDVLGFV